MKIFQAVDMAGQLTNGGDVASSWLASLLATIQSCHPLWEVFLASTIILLLLLLWSTLWMFRLNRTLSRMEASHSREEALKSRQIQMLQHQIHSFDDARDGYLNLITNMSFVLRNVNFRQNGKLPRRLAPLTGIYYGHAGWIPGEKIRVRDHPGEVP